MMILFGVKLGGSRSRDLVAGPRVARHARRIADAGAPRPPRAAGRFAGVGRMSGTRGRTMLEVIRRNTSPPPRAKGLPEGTVVFRHAMRNALLPVITILGSRCRTCSGGRSSSRRSSRIPGMGQTLLPGVMSRDYPLIMGIHDDRAFLTLLETCWRRGVRPGRPADPPGVRRAVERIPGHREGLRAATAPQPAGGGGRRVILLSSSVSAGPGLFASHEPNRSTS